MNEVSKSFTHVWQVCHMTSHEVHLREWSLTKILSHVARSSSEVTGFLGFRLKFVCSWFDVCPKCSSSSYSLHKYSNLYHHMLCLLLHLFPKGIFSKITFSFVNQNLEKSFMNFSLPLLRGREVQGIMKIRWKKSNFEQVMFIEIRSKYPQVSWKSSKNAIFAHKIQLVFE